MEKSYLELFLEHKDSLATLTTDNVFYDAMENCIDSGESKYSLFNRFFDKKIDLRWVEEIEACIIPLDNIMRVPRKFIIQEEEIVPIERARKITNESIRHLAQHTNMIAKVEGDDVTPNQILNVFREESYEVYENRFVYTLMQNLIRFIDLRYDALFKVSDDDNMASLKMESEFKRGREKVIYKLEVSAQSGGNEMEDTANIDGENASAFQRIERIKKIINEYAHSSFMKQLQNCVPVRPPIMRTNAIQKNPNFKACLKLWQFIQSYTDLGYEITVKESNDMVSDEYRNQLNSMMSINYMMLKANTISEDAVGKQKRRKLKPKLLKRLAEELVLDYDMEDIEIQRVFVDEIKRVSKRKMDAEKKIQDAIQRALDSENARKKAIEDKIKAKIAHEKEMERRRIAKEKEKERLAKQREKERLAKEREKARIAREKAKERERIAKQKAKERARLEKEKEKLRLQKEKERAAKLKAAEDIRIAKAKQREEMRLAKEQAAKQAELEKQKAAKLAAIEKEKAVKAKEKEKIAKAKAAEREKAKAAALKQKTKEKERIAKEKVKEQERLAKAKAAEKEKAKAELAKKKEKEALEKSRAVQAEKARIAKEKAKEKELVAKEKAKAKQVAAKEKAAEKAKADKEKAKAKEKEKVAKLRAAQAEKERIAKERAKEKERIAREKIKEQERIAKEKAKEKERIAKEKARAKAKEQEKIAREKAKAKAKALKEKGKSNVKSNKDE